MQEEIKNRVSESKLITFDLEDFYPKGERVVLDIKNWLYHELILKETDFVSKDRLKSADLKEDFNDSRNYRKSK